ncbi:MAG: C45 family autoproteolytic acyltransferase/hydrolase [Candidatus Aminicenantes bacterium]|jgi:predicted choloylglycine hydrolase
MKKSIFILTSAILIFTSSQTQSFPHQTPLTTKENLKVLVLEGTPYERGLQHGTVLKKEIHELVKIWKEDIQKTYKTDADVFIKKFLAATDFEKAIKEWTPELWQELKGISEGSGLEFDTIFAFQLVDEIWVLGRDVQAEKCTTIGLEKTERHPAMVAQNLDIPPFYHGFQTLLHIKDKEQGLETYLFTFPGFIAANGLNSRSVAAVVNAVQQLENSRDGLPVAFVIRGILQRRSYDEALQFIKTIKHGAPQNYMIGDANEMGSFECSVTQVSEFIPFTNASFTYHTNHPLKNMNFSSRFKQYLKSKDVSPKDYKYPCPRFQALQKIFKDNSVPVEVNTLKDIFSNRDIIINNKNTFGCTIMKLGTNPELHISPGRPDEEPFQIFRF